MSDIVVRRDELARVIFVAAGDSLTLELHENRTTGYRWEVAELPAFMRVEEATYRPAVPPLAGAPGVRRLRFAIDAAGSGTVLLRLRRPWEPPDRATDNLRFRIRAG